jgi:hypothetical protein
MVADGGYTATGEIVEGSVQRRQGVAEQVTEADLTPEAVADSTGGRYWSVDDCAWSSVCPSLPDELVALLAPPVLVGATPVGERGGGPGDRQSRR